MIIRSMLILASLVLSPFGKSIAAELGEDFTKSIINLTLRLPVIIPSNENETEVTSSVCAAMILGALQQGAGGNSSKQIDSLLGFGSEDSKKYFRTLLDYVQDASSDDVLHWGNKMFVRNDLEIDGDYQENVKTNFKMVTQKVNFDLDDIASSMNDWIGLITDENTQDAFNPSFFTPDTFMVLASAISFRDEWDTPFHVRDTEDDVFHVNGTMNVTVPFMIYKNRNTTMGQNNEAGIKWIRLGYSKSPTMFILFVLPTKRFGLNELIKSLTYEVILQMMREEKTEMANIAIPKLNITTHKFLKPSLKKLGVVDIFDEEADLSGMIKSGKGPKISDISHSCKIEINEKGTIASAVTSANFQFLSGSMEYPDNPVFKADQPFLFILYEKNTILPYFYGQVYNPRG